MKRILNQIPVCIKQYYIFWILALPFTSCLRLDDNLFNPDNSIKSYRLDNYTGEVDFTLDSNYRIPDSLIHLFTLSSKGENEKEATIIYALYIGSISKIQSDTVILYCHGNRDHIDFYWQRAKLLANTGGKNRFGVMTYDYRGYGLSEGKPSEEGLYEDTRTAIEWLKSKGLSSDRLIIYGFSMGTAPAVFLSANSGALTPHKIILEAPFASSEVMVQDGALLSLPSSFFTDLKINNAEEIKKVSQPLLWIHGTVDDFLSIKTHGEIVFKNHNGKFKTPLRVTGANHGNVPVVMGFQTYLEELKNFIYRR